MSATPEIITLEAVKRLSKKKQQDLRLVCQTNLLFLANNVLRAPSQLELKDFHREMCSFLPQCDPTVPMEYWSAIKEHVLLSARGSLKSTVLSAYVTQIILCLPNVRVMLICGNRDKAHELIGLVRRHLQHPVLAHLFPEHQNLNKGDSFTTPARSVSLRDATLFGGSFRTINTGAHADFIFLDDAATELAHRTQSGIQKTIDSMDDLQPVLEAGGYLSFFGTRWAENDCPAIMFQRAAEIEKQTGERVLDCLELPAWTVKQGCDTKTPLTADDVDLLWAEKLSFQFLFRIFSKTPELFKKQYLLQVEPAVEEEPTVQPMTEDLLEQCRISTFPDIFKQIPVGNADLASVSEKPSDNCAIVGGWWDLEAKTLTISDMVNKKFTQEHDFLKQTWHLYDGLRIGRTHKIRFRVEQAQGAEQSWDEKFKAIQVHAEFLPSFSSKDERIWRLFEALRSGKVKFSTDKCWGSVWTDVIKQFTQYEFNVPHSHMKDDLIDSCAGLYEFCCQKITQPDEAPFHTRNAREIALFGQELGDEPIGSEVCCRSFDKPACAPIAPAPARRGYSDWVKIRRPDVQKGSEPFSDPAYSRMFSVNKYADTPL